MILWSSESLEVPKQSGNVEDNLAVRDVITDDSDQPWYHRVGQELLSLIHGVRQVPQTSSQLQVRIVNNYEVPGM